MNGAHIAAILSGHIHIFAATSFFHEPPLMIVGTGGDNLDTGSTIAWQHDSLDAVTDSRFGFAALEARKLSCS